MKQLYYLTFLLFGIPMPVSAQSQLHTYNNGAFEDGKAFYTYREEIGDDDPLLTKRIYHGKFSYKSRDGSKSMSGKYENDRKEGLWIVDWCGFHEEVNYKNGVKHGTYRVRYNEDSEGNQLQMNAHFTYGELDSLDFWMFRSDGTVFKGIQNPNFEYWTQGVDLKYLVTDYFKDKIYLGQTVQDNSTGDWGKTTLSEIRTNLLLIDSLKNRNYEYEGTYYKYQPQKKNTFLNRLKSNRDIFTVNPHWMNEIAYFFLYNFHLSCFGSSLWRGEVFQLDYTLCYTIEEDIERKEQIQQEEQRKALASLRKEQEYRNAIARKEAEFKQTEYGKLITYLKDYTGESDAKFEQAKRDYVYMILGGYHVETESQQVGQISLEYINFQYSPNISNGFMSTPISQNYNCMLLPNEIKDFHVMILPLALALRQEQWIVTDAIMVFYNKTKFPIQATSLELGNRLIAKKESDFFITLDYHFHSYSPNKSIVMQPIASNPQYKKNGIYYSIWKNPHFSQEEFLRSITKEEVEKPIAIRFNIKKEE